MRTAEHRCVALARPWCTFAVAFVWRAAHAAERFVDLQQCTTIVERERRLDCFDRLAAEPRATGDAAAVPAASTSTPAAHEAVARPVGPFDLAAQWELSEADKRGVFSFRPHRDNYVLFANYAAQPNSAPYVAAGRLAPDATLAHTEVAFQLSFKMKLVENALRLPLDVWFGYTQDSFWQAYNGSVSRPFRETDYQPELMAVVPLDLSPGGVRRVQASWAFPLIQNLKGYVQIFSGYGASLVDYNSYQHTYGLGVLVDF